ncbi:hypothetical protein D7322_01680 [Sphingobacterium puteale]|uniref:DUF5000 domain-containing protein n=1 Tax=Sphingobacterium puteale TaxID=2420510 RepID=A0A420W474_9SPHI|nr:DUF4998 domain-containing protein [Sphingobacterium puteale]RKO73402.1 hypothetical protein D7322_01680 [Sphingobacterium puteale]
MRERYVFIMIALLLVAVGCSKMDEYKKFTDGKELNYAAKNDTLKILPGNNRLKLTWWVITDPNVVRTVIYMNNRADSIVLPVKREPGKQKFEYLMDPLPEGNYSFEVVNFNNLGSRSVASFVSGRSYGNRYKETLLNRSLLNHEIQNDESVKINWGTADVQSYGVDIEYTDNKDKLVKVRLKSEAKDIRLTNYKKGSTFRYQTLFLPDTLCIDTFRTDWAEVKPLFDKPMDKALFKAVVLPGDAPMVPGDGYRIENAWDGVWPTEWGDYGNWRSLSSDLRSKTEPARVTFDLGESVQLSRFRINHYWPYENRMMKRYEIYGRADKPTNGDMAGWTKLYNFERTDQSEAAWLAGDNGSFNTTLPGVRYIRIVCYENYMNPVETDMGFAEITFWKYY